MVIVYNSNVIQTLTHLRRTDICLKLLEATWRFAGSKRREEITVWISLCASLHKVTSINHMKKKTNAKPNNLNSTSGVLKVIKGKCTFKAALLFFCCVSARPKVEARKQRLTFCQEQQPRQAKIWQGWLSTEIRPEASCTTKYCRTSRISPTTKQPNPVLHQNSVRTWGCYKAERVRAPTSNRADEALKSRSFWPCSS